MPERSWKLKWRMTSKEYDEGTSTPYFNDRDRKNAECSESKWTYLCPGSPRYVRSMVPARFSRMVLSHAVCVLRGNIDKSFASAPIFLVVVGEPGTGKTHQAIASLVNGGFGVLYCSASKLTGVDLGASAEAVTELYSTAASQYQSRNNIAIVIDDFHLGEAAVVEGTNTTVNSNLLTSRLMNLCDDAGVVRVPVVLTVNRTDGIDPALLRDGRSRLYRWKPSFAETKAVVTNLFRAAGIDDASSRVLIENYSEENVAFFSAVVEEARRAHVAQEIERLEYSGLTVGDLCFAPELRPGCGADELLRAARRLSGDEDA